MCTNDEIDLERRVVGFVSDFVGVDPSKLSMSSSLREDLGVDGDDGPEILTAFSRKFGVDIEELLANSEDYFAAEGLFSGRLFPPNRDITIEQLVLAARRGKWTAPDESDRNPRFWLSP